LSPFSPQCGSRGNNNLKDLDELKLQVLRWLGELEGDMKYWFQVIKLSPCGVGATLWFAVACIQLRSGVLWSYSDHTEWSLLMVDW